MLVKQSETGDLGRSDQREEFWTLYDQIQGHVQTGDDEEVERDIAEALRTVCAGAGVGAAIDLSG